jgi:MFS superfamily sulfate permease-like transporter
MGVERFVKFICSFLPILKWLPKYEWKQNLMGDAMAGLTIAVVHVPQGRLYTLFHIYSSYLGIAYAVLCGLEPVHGLYTSFFGVLFYMLFGTSKCVSVGTLNLTKK